jgi:IS605 OrfB family transposase
MISTHTAQIKCPRDTPYAIRCQLKKSSAKAKRKEQISAIAACLQSSRRMISEGKSKTCKDNSLIVKSSQTLEAALTLKGGGFLHSSREHLKAVSDQLWLPTEIDCVASDSNLSNGYSNNTELYSKFSIQRYAAQEKKCAKISCQSYTYFPVEKMVKEDTKPKKPSKRSKMKTSALKNLKPVCNYIIVKSPKRLVGINCCNEATHNGRCADHAGLKQPSYKSLRPMCTHILQQGKNKEGISRMGLPCGKEATTGTLCKSHSRMVLEGSLTRAFRVRLNPNKETRDQYAKVFGCCNKTYNLCVADEDVYARRKELSDIELKEILRDKYISKNNDYPYLREAPRQPRDRKIRDYITNIQNTEKQYQRKIESAKWRYVNTKYKSKNMDDRKTIKEAIDKTSDKYKDDIQYINEQIIPKIKVPQMTLFKKRNQDSVIEIPKESVDIGERYILPYKTKLNNKIYFYGKHKRDRMLKRITQDNILKCDCKLEKTLTNKYYAIFNYKCDPAPSDHVLEHESSTCAIDPGSRNFATVYDPKGRAIIIHDRTRRIRRLHYDILALRKLRQENKLRMCKHAIRMKHERIKNIVKDMHYETIKTLFSEYGTIFIPKMNTNRMVRNKTLPRIVKRELSSLAHSNFRSRLKTKAETCGVTVHVVEEMYTSMMCGACLTLHEIGKRETYDCPTCGIKINRDINGARNIFLKRVNFVNQ